MDRLGKDAADTSELRAYLTFILKSADAALTKTQSEYEKVSGKNLSPNPIFFEDLHLRYQALITDVNDPRFRGAAAEQSGHLVEVQLKTRPAGSGAPTFTGSYPPVALAAIDLIRLNLNIYAYLLDQGTDSFTVVLRSIPSGASISVTRIGQPIQQLSIKTNAEKTLPLAEYTFIFEMPGCKPRRMEAYPELEKKPVLTAELQCK